jgi:hypothetical protein
MTHKTAIPGAAGVGDRAEPSIFPGGKSEVPLSPSELGRPADRDQRRPGFFEFFAGSGMARIGLGPSWRCLFANENDNDFPKSASFAPISAALPSSRSATSAA